MSPETPEPRDDEKFKKSSPRTYQCDTLGVATKASDVISGPFDPV